MSAPPPSAGRGAQWAERLAPPALGRLALGLAVGAAGGAAAHAAGAPLAWMLGALFACMFASLAGAPVMVPIWFRTLFLGVVGLFLGESFADLRVEDLARWPVSLAAAALYPAAGGAACYALFRAAARMPRATALLCAVPGGLTAVSLFAAEVGGDERRVALAQSLRVALVVLAAPVVAFGWLGLPRPAAAGAHPAALMSAPDAALLTGAALAATLLAGRLRVPLPYLVGPLAVSAALRPAGVVSGALPGWLVEAALTVCGASIGTRFAGFGLRQLAVGAAWTLAGTIVLMAVSWGFAAAVAALTGIGLFAALLAYAPGGVAEMSLIALAIGADPAFVATHHMARILTILIALPALGGPLRRFLAAEAAPSGARPGGPGADRASGGSARG